jgi:hypothetical protein
MCGFSCARWSADEPGEDWLEPSGGESAFPFSNEVAGITDAFDNARESRDIEGTADALLAFDALL